MSLVANRRGFMFILSSPSGAGKTTLSRMLLESDDYIEMSVSATTRARRPNEVEGEDYHFLDTKTFEQMVHDAEFLEHAKVFDHYYGTPKAPVFDALHQGVDVLFDIDWQGTQQVASKCPGDVVSIFILPPSMAELERRLRTRAADSELVIQSRMSKAASEISHWDAYDYVLVNRDIGESLATIQGILRAERHKRIRQQGLSDYVEALLQSDESK